MRSREVEGLISYVARQGVPFKVTDVDTPGVHATGSYHYRQGTGGIGLAIDLAGPSPSWNSPELLRLFAAFVPVQSQLAELIYSGAPYSIKDGRKVPLYAINAHWNHVHVAVPKGVILDTPIQEKPLMPDDPNVPNLFDIKFFVPIVRASDGVCTGYYFVSSKGEIHAHGDGAPFHGRSEVVA